MLDALEWAVNKTRLGDARLDARLFEEAALAEVQNSTGKVAREVERVSDNERGVAPPAHFNQATSKSCEL